MLELKSFYFKDDILYILDQRKLPHKEVYFEAKNVEDVAYAIKAMLVRGAPAIGCVAAYGFYIGIKDGLEVEKVYDILSNTRPTAVNLFWALKRMKQAYFENKDLLEEAKKHRARRYTSKQKNIGVWGFFDKRKICCTNALQHRSFGYCWCRNSTWCYKRALQTG